MCLARCNYFFLELFLYCKKLNYHLYEEKTETDFRALVESKPSNSICYFLADQREKMKRHCHQHRMHIQQFLSFHKQFHAKILFPNMWQEETQYYNIDEQKPCLPFSQNHGTCNFWKVTISFQILEEIIKSNFSL